MPLLLIFMLGRGAADHGKASRYVVLPASYDVGSVTEDERNVLMHQGFNEHWTAETRCRKAAVRCNERGMMGRLIVPRLCSSARPPAS